MHRLWINSHNSSQQRSVCRVGSRIALYATSGTSTSTMMTCTLLHTVSPRDIVGSAAFKLECKCFISLIEYNCNILVEEAADKTGTMMLDQL